MVLLVLLAGEGAAHLAERKVDALPEWSYPHVADKIEQMREWRARKGRADVVFLGSSVGNAAYDCVLFARVAGLDGYAYNASLSGAAERTLERWTHSVVLPLLDPREIVITVTPADLNDRGAAHESAHRNFVRAPGLAEFEATGVRAVMRRIGRRSALIRLRPTLQAMAHNPSGYRHVIDLEVAGNLRGGLGANGESLGYRARHYEMNPRRLAELEQRTLNDFEIGGIETEALTALIEDLRDRGVGVTLVATPVADEVVSRFLPHGEADLRRFDEVLAGIAANTGARLIDLRGASPDLAWLADEHHLNGVGTEAVTRAVATALRESALADRR